MRRITRTRAAEADVEEVLAHLLERSEAAADHFAAALDQQTKLLDAQPRIGCPRYDLAPGVRSVVIGRHVVFFRATDDELVVLRIIHGSRDIPQVFGDP